MRASTVASLLALAVSQTTAQYYSDQSPPFTLQLVSANATINGQYLIPCHEGAAIEGLCYGSAVAGAPVTTYNFNYSSSSTPDPKIGVVGILTYELRGGNFNVSSPLELAYNAASNIAVPLFTPGEDYQEVVFDKYNKLAIPGYDDIDPSTEPASTELYYRWYACLTNEGYVYETLAWVLGDTKPENPTCQKVDVVRKFTTT